MGEKTEILGSKIKVISLNFFFGLYLFMILDTIFNECVFCENRTFEMLFRVKMN